MRHARYFAILLLLFGIAHPVLSQSESQANIRVTSRLVVLDVTVVDSKGAPVPDLEQKDFTVYEGADLQPIRSFEPFSAHTLPSSLAKDSINNARDLQRLLPQTPVTLLVLDELNTNFEDTAFARTQLRKYLQSQPPVLAQPTSFLVATDSSFTSVQDYTLDRDVLLERLAKLKPALPGKLMRSAGSREGVAVRFAQTLSTLQQIAQANAGIQGRKNVIWVGRGFTSIDLRDSPDFQIQLVRGAAERILNLMRDAHVVLYTIDPTLSTGFVQTDPTTVPADAQAAFLAEVHNARDPFDGTVSFNTLAPESGGRAFSIFNDLDREIATSVADGSAFYTISYVPTGSSDAGKPYRDIHVRVDRPGLTVLTRKGYFATVPPPPVRTAEQNKKVEGFDIAQAVVSRMTFTGLGVVAGAGSQPGSYVVEVTTNDVRWQVEASGGRRAELILAAVALDSKNKPVAQAVRQVTASVPATIPVESIPFATLTIELAVPANTDRIRFVVRDAGDGRMGSAEVNARDSIATASQPR